MKGGVSIPPFYKLEGEPSKGYYLGMRLTFSIFVFVLIYVFYNILALDYSGPIILFYVLNGITFSFLVLLFYSLFSSTLVHSLKKRKIIIDKEILSYYIDNQIKKIIPVNSITEVILYRYSLSRMTPLMLGVFTEQNILIKYTEKSKHKKLRLYYIDFLPLGTLDSLFEALNRISQYFPFHVRDKSKPLLY